MEVNTMAGKVEVIKVSAHSEPKRVAGVIAAIVRRGDAVEIDAIGAGAVNQTVMSIALARGYSVSNGIDLVFYPSFVKMDVNGVEKTSIKFAVERRK